MTMRFGNIRNIGNRIRNTQPSIPPGSVNEY